MSTKATRYEKILRILLPLLTLFTILFIFSNSMEVATVSSGRSGAVTGLLNGWMGTLGLAITFPEGFVRKLAHLAEYALLGFWLLLTLRVYSARLLSHLSWPLFVGLSVAVVDEYLQLFTSGRSSQVQDVLIDFFGVLMGILAMGFLLLLCRGFCKERHAKSRRR